MENTVYDNFVLESKLNDLLETKLNTRSLMTIDETLTGTPGMVKQINVYSFTGAVEKLTKGAKNTVRGALTHQPKEYRVALAQQVFDYFDEEVMQDPLVVDYGMEGVAGVMVNDFNAEYFSELAKATLNHKYTDTFKYDDVVDAIQLMNLEDESGLYLVIGTDLKAEVRKDTDFKSSRQGEIMYNGQIGTIAGVPVLISKKVAADTAYLATKEAVTCFVKKDSEIEQERDGEARKNTVIARKVNLIALTNATKVVKITKA